MSEFTLPNKKVFIKPIIKKGKWLSESHSGSFMYDNTRMTITVPIDGRTGELKDPLTKEEREYFESKKSSGLDFQEGELSPYKKADPRNNKYGYWHTFEYKLLKSMTMVDDKTILDMLDLSKPIDYIKYKVLLANSGNGGIVAPSWEERFDQGTYRIAVVDAMYEEETKANKLDKQTEAHKFVAKIVKSHDKMFEFLSVYWLENRNAIKPSVDSTIDWLKAEIMKVLEKDVDTFLSIVNSNYEEKLLIHNGMVCGAIKRYGQAFQLPDGTPLGNSISEAISYFKDEKHNEEKLKLIAQIDANKG